jgi:hypothetical protein
MAVFPNEAYPADGVVLGLDGQVDAATGLPYIARGVNANSSPAYEVQYNRRLLRQNGILAALRQGMVVDEGGLQVGIYPIRYTLGGVRKDFAGASGVAVPDDATRVVYLDAANALQLATSFPTNLSTFLPLATVVAAGGTLAVTDERVLTLFTVG